MLQNVSFLALNMDCVLSYHPFRKTGSFLRTSISAKVHWETCTLRKGFSKEILTCHKPGDFCSGLGFLLYAVLYPCLIFLLAYSDSWPTSTYPFLVIGPTTPSDQPLIIASPSSWLFASTLHQLLGLNQPHDSDL